MGRQESLIQLNGAVGNISFYKSREDGYLARKKSGVAGSRILSDPAYERTRENMAEFARAAEASKLFRTAIRSLIVTSSDKRMAGRLTRGMVAAIREDAINTRGERNVTDGDVRMLKGFEFNRYQGLRETVLGGFTTSIDRATGAMTIDIPAFKPNVMIKVPEGASHLRFKAGAVSIDFQTGTYGVNEAVSELVLIDKNEHGPFQIAPAVEPGSVNALFLILGVEFLQVIKSGEEFPLKSGQYNAMSIVQIDITE